MLVSIFICGLVGFIALKLCGKFELEYERNTLRILGVCRIIAFIAVVIGVILCIFKLALDFNVINWITLTVFILNIVYAYFSGWIPELEIRYTIGAFLFIIGTIFSILGYQTINLLIMLTEI